MPRRKIVAAHEHDLAWLIELWKAIHGGCWPGPPPDLRLSEAARDVVAGLATLNLANAFGDAASRKAISEAANASLRGSISRLNAALEGRRG